MSGSAGAEEVQLSNATADTLIVWLEPWAQEFTLLPRGLLHLRCKADNGIDPQPEIETSDQLITIWGQGGSRIAVFIDGVDQLSFSADYAAPDDGPLSPRAFVDLVFGDTPGARPGGLPLPSLQPNDHWWQRLLRAFKR